MKSYSLSVLLLATVVVMPLQAQLKFRSTYSSPDSQRHVIISDMKSAFQYVSEGVVEFRSNAKKLLLKKDYTSEDGEHGYAVDPIGWTADSKYFLYGLTSTGGDQSWHHGIEVYSSRTGKIVHLDNYLGPITIGQEVTLAPPDSVFVTLTDTTQLVTFKVKNHRASLSKLLSTTKLKTK